MLHLPEDRLARVCRSRDLATPEWVRLVNTCEQFLSVPLPYGGAEQNYALAGLVSGDQRYRQKAIQLAMDRCALGYKALDGWGYGHWGSVRTVVPSLCCVYDWLYSDLTQSQQDTLATWIVNFGRLCWTETQPLDKLDTWARQPKAPGDNFFAGFLLASFVSALVLIAHGGAPAAQGQALLAVARSSKWTTQLLPHKRQYEPAGFPLEGTSYGLQAWSNLALTVDAVKSMTGEDIWPEMAGLINNYLLHITTPDLKRLMLWGDDARITAGKGVVMEPMDDYATLLPLVAQNQIPQSGSPTSFAWWLSAVQRTPNTYPFPWMAWAPVLFARPELRENGSAILEPLVSPGNGIAIAAQSSAKNATQLSFICGPILETHQPKAPGAIQIYKDGEALIGIAGLWGQVPELGRGAEHHSTLLLPPYHVSEPAWNDPGQPQGLKDAQASVKITRSEDKDGVLYLEGSLAGAYAYRNPVWNDDPAKRWLSPLKKWIRRILWHRVHDLFLVIDEIEREPWSKTPVITWQVRDRPSVSLMAWSATAGDWEITGHGLPGVASQVEAVGNSFRVVVPMPQGLSSALVQCLQVRRASAGEQLRFPTRYESGGALGVTFGSGAQAVTLAVQMGDAPPPIEQVVYTLQIRDFTDAKRFNSRDLLFAALTQALHDAKRSDTIRIKSYLESNGGGTSPDGEFILIEKEAANAGD